MLPFRVVCSFFLVSSVLLHNYIVSAQYRRVCYYTNWAQYRPVDRKFFPEDIDPSLCTHIVYAFAKLNGNKLVAFEWNDESTDWMKGMYDRYNAIKAQNPEIKTLLAVGGWNMASEPFTAMVATPASRAEFARSTVQFLRQRKFDGIDIDWEYPANRGSPPEDKHRYTLLVQEVRRVFDQEAKVTGRAPLLLTSAVAAGKSNVDSAYDVPQICRDMDFISVMSYDLHGSWENITGHNSPLYAHAQEAGDRRFLNMDWAANYWVQMGCPKHKLVIGMGLYGRTFTLKDSYQNGLMAPVKGPGKAGKYTREKGFLAYYEICDLLAKGGQSYYIKDQEVPYAVSGDQWIGYDDVDSLRKKVQWLKQNGFSGVMVWSLDLDDFNGKTCGQGPYPLLTVINQELLGNSMVRPAPRQQSPRPRPQKPKPTFQKRPRPQNTWSNNQWTAQPTINTNILTGGNDLPSWTGPVVPTMKSLLIVTPKPKPKPTTSLPNMPHLTNEFSCPPGVEAYFPNPNSCSEYYTCAGGFSFKFKCTEPLQWNSEANFCDWPDKVVCAKTPKPATPKPAPPKPEIPKAPVRKPVRLPPTRPQESFPQPRPIENLPPPRTFNNIIPAIRQQTQQAANSAQIFPEQPRRRRPQNQQPPSIPAGILPPRKTAHERRFVPTQAAFRTTVPPPTYPTPPWNEWYRFLSEFWRVMATLGASPSEQGGNILPGTIAGLPQPDRPATQQTQQPISFCTNKPNGVYPDVSDCTKYIECVQTRTYKFSCPGGTAFHSQHLVCDYKHKITRCNP